MLKLRRGYVVQAEDPAASPIQKLLVDVRGERRPAWGDLGLVGPSRPGDEIVLNVAARDLGLGSGGADLVHVNLTRGLAGQTPPGAHVMKLNYTSLQHPVQTVEGPALAVPLGRPAGVLALHGQLAPVAWALGEALPGARVGYVQTAGGALPGALSDTVRELRRRRLLAAHVTAAPAYGGELEAFTTAGALQYALTAGRCDVALVGPGPGIVGSGTALGHGGLAALDAAHTALSLGCPTVLAARVSARDPRERHRGLSHHTRTVLDLVLAPVVVALPDGLDGDVPARHERRRVAVDLVGYRNSGLPAETMGRPLEDDPTFFAAALAAGTALADMIDA